MSSRKPFFQSSSPSSPVDRVDLSYLRGIFTRVDHPRLIRERRMFIRALSLVLLYVFMRYRYRGLRVDMYQTSKKVSRKGATRVEKFGSRLFLKIFAKKLCGYLCDAIFQSSVVMQVTLFRSFGCRKCYKTEWERTKLYKVVELWEMNACVTSDSDLFLLSLFRYFNSYRLSRTSRI